MDADAVARNLNARAHTGIDLYPTLLLLSLLVHVCVCSNGFFLWNVLFVESVEHATVDKTILDSEIKYLETVSVF